MNGTKWLNQRRELLPFFRDAAAAGWGGGLREELFDRCFNQMASTYDAENGGFGTGAKFPRPSVFIFLLPL